MPTDKIRVLMIDDEEVIHRLCRIFSTDDFEITWVSNYLSAQTALSDSNFGKNGRLKNDFDAVILDCCLGDVNGPTVLSQDLINHHQGMLCIFSTDDKLIRNGFISLTQQGVSNIRVFNKNHNGIYEAMLEDIKKFSLGTRKLTSK